MKKIAFIAVGLTAISFTGFSQAKFGLQIGGNVGFNRVETANTDDFSNKPRIGVLAGFLADIPMGPVSFRPEVNFIQKGAQTLETTTVLGTTYENEVKLRLNYIELPLNFVYNVPTSNSGKFFFGLGPNFALGLSGKTEYENTATAGSTIVRTNGKSDVKFSGDNASDPNTTYLKRFDFGGNVLAGYTAGMGLTFNVGYTLGFADISRNTNDEYTRKNHGVTLKVGYMLGGASAPAPSTAPAGSMIF